MVLTESLASGAVCLSSFEDKAMSKNRKYLLDNGSKPPTVGLKENDSNLSYKEDEGVAGHSEGGPRWQPIYYSLIAE